MGLEREPTCYLRDRGTTTKCAGYFCMFRLGPQSSHTRCPHSHTGTRLFSLKQIGHSTFLPRCRLKPSSITTSMHRRTSTMHMIWAPGSSSLERSPTWRHEAARRHLGVVDPLGACVAHGSSCCQDEAQCFALMRPRTHCLLPFDHAQLLDSAQTGSD